MTDLALNNRIVDSRRQKEPAELYPMLRNNPVLRIYHDFGVWTTVNSCYSSQVQQCLVESRPLISALSRRRTVPRLRCSRMWPPKPEFLAHFYCCPIMLFHFNNQEEQNQVCLKALSNLPPDCSQSLYNSHKNKTLKYVYLRVIKRYGRSGQPQVPSEQPTQIRTKIGPPTVWMGMRLRLDSSNCNIGFASVKTIIRSDILYSEVLENQKIEPNVYMLNRTN